MIRRSFRLAVKQSGRNNRTAKEIQSNTYSLQQVHKRELMDDWRMLHKSLHMIEELVKQNTHIGETTKAAYLEILATIRTACNSYHWIAFYRLDKMNETNLTGKVPCVVFMHTLRWRIHQFASALKHDTADHYLMKEIYHAFCDRLLIEIRENTKNLVLTG